MPLCQPCRREGRDQIAHRLPPGGEPLCKYHFNKVPHPAAKEVVMARAKEIDWSEVKAEIAEGGSVDEAARRLGVHPTTLRGHIGPIRELRASNPAPARDEGSKRAAAPDAFVALRNKRISALEAMGDLGHGLQTAGKMFKRLMNGDPDRHGTLHVIRSTLRNCQAYAERLIEEEQN